MKNGLLQDRADRVGLVAIEGEQLSAVTFVQDYLQLHFDGPMLTTVTTPVIVTADQSYHFGLAGYRDRLCELIGSEVVRADVKPGDRLKIDFPHGVSLVVSLRPEAYRAAEAVTFRDATKEQWASW